jgi:hypothetical protein
MGPNSKKSKSKRYTAATASLKCTRRLPDLIAGALLQIHLPPEVNDLLHQWEQEDRPTPYTSQDFKVGRPSYSLQSLFILQSLMRINGVHSESMMSQLLTHKVALKSTLHMQIPQGPIQKSPHPDRFKWMRDLLLENDRLEILEETLIRTLIPKGAFHSKLTFLDATMLDLCRDVNGGCKYLSKCLYAKEGDKVHSGCLSDLYPEAEYMHKDEDTPFLGFKWHVLKDYSTGLTLCSKLTGAKKAENHMALEMLPMSAHLLSSHKYLVADRGYDDSKVYSSSLENGLIPIIPLRDLGHARFFVINEVNRKRKYRVGRDGTPLCTKGYPMNYIESEEGFTYWGCPQERIKSEDMEDDLCLGYHESRCKCFEVDISKEPRRLCQIPRSEEKWRSIYSKRSHGERMFAWEDHFMGTNQIPFNDLDSIQFYLRMGNIIHLMMAHVACDLGFPKMVEPWDVPHLVNVMRDDVLLKCRRGIRPWLWRSIEEVFDLQTQVLADDGTDRLRVVVKVAPVA